MSKSKNNLSFIVLGCGILLSALVLIFMTLTGIYLTGSSVIISSHIGTGISITKLARLLNLKKLLMKIVGLNVLVVFISS